MSDLRTFADQAHPNRSSEALGRNIEQKSRSSRRRRPAPFSLRLTAQERAVLEQAAGEMSLGTYIRHKLFDGDIRPRPPRRRYPVKDHAALGQVLGALGRSRLSSNLNQLAKAAHGGALPVTPELEEELREACAAIRRMRDDLMRALGHYPREDTS